MFIKALQHLPGINKSASKHGEEHYLPENSHLYVASYSYCTSENNYVASLEALAGLANICEIGVLSIYHRQLYVVAQ